MDAAESALDGSTFAVVIAAYAANTALYPGCRATLATASPALR